MFCNKCGKEIADEALICPYCGCGTVNYVRDQAKAEARASVQAAPQPLQKSALLRCSFACSSAVWGRTVFMSAKLAPVSSGSALSALAVSAL